MPKQVDPPDDDLVDRIYSEAFITPLPGMPSWIGKHLVGDAIVNYRRLVAAGMDPADIGPCIADGFGVIEAALPDAPYIETLQAVGARLAAAIARELAAGDA